MNIRIDARGKQCPLPMIEAKNAINEMQEPGTVEVLADNEIAVQNIVKMAEHKGFRTSSSNISGNEHCVHIFVESITIKNEEQAGMEEQEVTGTEISSEVLNDGRKNTIVVLSSDCMGEGDKKLGRILMKGYIYALTQLETLPDTILMYNSGAYLSIKDSESAEDLRLLETEGVEILTCGTCLNHYGLTEKLAVGSITDMYTIAERLSEAGKIIRP